MTPGSRHGPSLAEVLALAARQHGLVTRAQLLDAGLSPEAIRHRRRAYRADFIWPGLGLVVEVDDRSSHDGYVAFHEDRVRDRTMQSAGLEVLRFTRNEVLQEPSQVAAETRAARTRRAAPTTAP